MLWFDKTIWLLIPGFLLALWAQFKVRAAFEKYSRVPASSGLTGAEVARELLRGQGAEVLAQPGPESAAAALRAVKVELTQGTLSDHYDPRARILRLSPPVYGGNSLAALGVAAHETGHALQHASGYGPLGLRSAFLPVASIGSNLAVPLFLVGLIFAGPLKMLMDIGILLYIAALAFTLLTLPVEFNASRRAIALLQQGGYVQSDEVAGTKAVLDAAALTYLAAAVMALLTLIRLLLLRGQRD